MNTDGERSEHATSVDHSVATMLINVVSHDMSPLVRKVSLFYLSVTLVFSFNEIIWTLLSKNRSSDIC